jgi:ABC-2 type transport system permease protein
MIERVRTIVDKEWAEVFKHRVVLFTIVFMPLILTALPLIFLGISKSLDAGGGSTADMPAAFANACGGVTSASDCMSMFMVNQFLLMFMMMPLAIPIAIAAYSIVGEKTTRSLEPLLATPITTEELLAGKGLAAAIPAIAATVVCFGIFVALAPLVGASKALMGYIIGPIWLVAILVVGPLMAVLGVIFALIVSSRVNDPRVAEQVSMVLIVPLLAVLFAQIGGLIVLNVALMITAALLLLLIDIGLVFVGARLFQREAILTRWR